MKEKLEQFFRENFEDAVIRTDYFRDQLSFYLRPEYLFEVCQALMADNDLEVKMLSDICSLDWLGDPEEADGRFEVIYNLYSLKHSYRFFIKIRLSDDKPEVDSLTSLWHTADWLEREIYDLMGIKFIGHPDLRRILTADDVDGYPLRKDFPLTYEKPRFSYNKDGPPEVIT